MDAILMGQNPSPPTPNPTRYLFNFLFISFIFIKNKCFSVVMLFEIWKGRKKVCQKADSNRVDRVKRSTRHVLPSAPLELSITNRL